MISVCMATYNGARYIAEQLQSILSQLSADDEVVISDDASTDDTLRQVQLIASHSQVPIRIFSNEAEHGYTPNFENALRHAQGDYIFMSDQDDVWLPGKVSTMLPYLRDRGYDMVVSNARITDGDLHVTCEDYYSARGVHTGLLGNLVKFGYLGCCMAFTRGLLLRALPFPANRRYCTHDNWLFMCAQLRHRVIVLPQPLLLYRRHGHTSTTGAFNAHKPLSFRIRYRLYLVFQLAHRMLSGKL